MNIQTAQKLIKTCPGQADWDATDKEETRWADQLNALEVIHNPDEFAQEAMSATNDMLEAVDDLKEAEMLVESARSSLIDELKKYFAAKRRLKTKRTTLEEILKRQPEPMTLKQIVSPLAFTDPDIYFAGRL